MTINQVQSEQLSKQLYEDLVITVRAVNLMVLYVIKLLCLYKYAASR